MFQPLKGVKVIDLTYFVAGPGTAKILADWGADVIKVEPSFGDPGRQTGGTMSAPVEKGCNPWYSAYNANKRGLSLNLKDSDGRAILDRLLGHADVFVSSYRTAALKRLQLDYASVHTRHPGVVWAQINGFGDFGPARDNPGFDTVAYWARSGTMSDAAERGTALNPPIGFGDASTAGSLAGGIAAALYRKAKTGRGCKVMISLFAQAIWSASSEMVSTQYGDEYPKSRKNAVSPVINSFECKDGNWIFLSILEHDRYYPVLMDKVLGRGDLARDPRFCTAAAGKANGAELIEILGNEFKKHTRDEMVARLSAADIAHEKMQHFKEVLDDPQALENKYVVPVRNRDGTVTKQAMTPVRFAEEEPVCADDIEPTVLCQAPLIGEHSEAILREYGYSDEQIRDFRERGVITADTL